MTHSPRQLFSYLRREWDDGAVLLKAISFGLIGGVNFCVDLGIFLLGYYVFGLSIVTTNIVSWCVAVTGSYVMNSMITFAKESGRKLNARKYAGFVLMQSLGFLGNTTTVLIAQYFVPVWAGKIAAAGTSFVINFSMTHFVVFGRRNIGKPH